MSFFRFIPILIIPFIIYTMIALTSGAHMTDALAKTVFSINLVSHDHLALSLGTLITIGAILCMFVEVVRSALPTQNAIIENMSTAALLIVCVGLFLLARGFGTTEFFLITLLLLLDYLTDSTIMVFTARRTVEYTHN